MTNDELRDLRDAISAHLEGKPVEFNYRGQGWKTSPSGGGWYFETTLYRPKPEPATRPWNCPADVPMPVCWVRRPNYEASDKLMALILNVSDVGFEWQTNSVRMIYWDDVESITTLEYSTTCRRDDWHPLTVEVKS